MPPSQPQVSAPISVLMYHQVGRFANPKQHRSCYCEVDSFRRQMALLSLLGYRVISLEQARAAVFDQQPRSRPAVVLTFDDGYRNFAEYAYPILREYGHPATLFAVSGLLGQPARWLANGGVDAPLLSGAELRELRAGGIEIGSHSVSHPRLGRLDPAAYRAEIADSKAALEDLLGTAVESFAYPYGDYTPEVRDAVAGAGYRVAVTCSRGAARTAPHPLEIPRKAIAWGDDLLGFFWKLRFKNRRKERYA
ncbi:polysaccharide deacetylase family protein [Methylomagnum ishizawai]|uniref:polysaccharide deacetylase family protein n=1 Tax=Methylomagnum ishizawai TaxID=1760988 RepID=UPI001C32539C|nr:polysaccharide deacetylase family protein [Methylomagnum ishizawai]BBL75323.1 polysaccharide deacetylase [Methylomagnum ishizawai]